MQSYQIQVKKTKRDITEYKDYLQCTKKTWFEHFEMQNQKQTIQKVRNGKTKPNGTDGHIGTILHRENSTHQKNYFISCEDDCSSRKVASEWSERKRSIDVLDVLEDYIVENGKPEKVMHMIMVSSLHPKYSDIFYDVTI